MKYFFYTTLFLGSLGTAGAVMNPALVQQSAAFVGLKLPQNSAGSVENTSDEDQLSQFLAQYPFASNQNETDVVPASQIPMAVVSESVPSASRPNSPSDTMPAVDSVPLPEPVIKPAAPAYSSNQSSSSWDGEAAEPIAVPNYEPLVAENFSSAPVVDSTDWSGPAQSYQEPVPAPQQSVYVVPSNNPNVQNSHGSPQETTPVTEDPFAAGSASSSNFVPTNYSPPVTPPIPPVQEMVPVQAPQIEDVPMYGTEMVARVGRHVILMGDILPKLRRAALLVVAENLKQMPEANRTNISKEEVDQVINTFIAKQYPGFLQEQILAALVYNDYDISKSKAEKDFLYENMGKEFDRIEVSAMMKEFNVDSMAALKQYLSEQLGSSLERERRLWIQEQIVRQWIGLSVQRATGECTHDEMMEFYEANKAMFTTPARARWQEMTVMFSNYASEQDSRAKIRWMGNQVSGGAPFEEITKANSDGFTASKGGVWDWTAKGSLTSPELEQAIFSQPIGHLSPAIIQSDKGLHIIKVLEREETYVVPFVEAQVTIREKIRSQRIQRYQEEYFSDLRRRFPTLVLKDQIDFRAGNPRTANAAR